MVRCKPRRRQTKAAVAQWSVYWQGLLLSWWRFLLRVSDWANASAVLILWTFCQNSFDCSFAAEALQACALQKLLVLVQIGCSERAREKSTELLKLLNRYRKEWECADTMDLAEFFLEKWRCHVVYCFKNSHKVNLVERINLFVVTFSLAN